MQHLETERIAAFDHDVFTADELAHLAACTVCRTERNAFAALNRRSMHLAESPVSASAPRLTNWESLSTRLRAEGLIAGVQSDDVFTVDTADDVAREERFQSVMRSLNTPAERRHVDEPQVIPMESWWSRVKPRSGGEFMRAVAAVLLLALTGGAALNQVRTSVGTGNTENSATTAGLGLGLGNTGFKSIDEANKALARTEKEFSDISLWLTANDPSATKSDILRKRLAALDRMIAAARSELELAPQDQVLDHYYRAAYQAREVTLQQLGGALPVGRTLERF